MTAADAWLGVLQAAGILLILALLYVPLGDWMARTFTAVRDWRVERGVYRLIGVDSAFAPTWQAYARSVIAFSVVGVVFVYVLQRLQQWLPFSLGLPNVPAGLAFNTAVSFVTNTNWQSYTPETTLGYTVKVAADDGRAELRQWYASPVDRASPPRNELAIKLAMAVGSPDVGVRAVIQSL